MLYRGANGDPTVEAQVIGNGDLRLLVIQRDGVWRFSDIDTIGWWTWYTVSRADLPRLVGKGGHVLAAVQAAVAPGDEDETDDAGTMGGISRRFLEWLNVHGVPYTEDSFDEREP
jgi:hypothetical protein